MGPPRSKVEVKAKEAHYYDFFLDAVSLGLYTNFIKKAVRSMDIEPGQSVLDLGSGTGKNDCFILRKTGPEGKIVGLDISQEMLSLSRKRCQSSPNVLFQERRIDSPLEYYEDFDNVFISFVLHGFENDQKTVIIDNAYKALKPGGAFYVLDYNEFDLNGLWFPLRFVFIHGECLLAREFLKLDLKKMLSEHLFKTFEEKLFFRGRLRLLKAIK